jgi:hypothetical protein
MAGIGGSLGGFAGVDSGYVGDDPSDLKAAVVQ